MQKLSSLPTRQQNALAGLSLLPWLIFGVLALDLLPMSWRFGTWPESLRTLCIGVFSLYVLAETLFYIWYLLMQMDSGTEKAQSPKNKPPT